MRYLALLAAAGLILAVSGTAAATTFDDIDWSTMEPGFYVDKESGAQGDSWWYKFAYYPGYSNGICCINARLIAAPTGTFDQTFSESTGAFDGPPKTLPGPAGTTVTWVSEWTSDDLLVGSACGDHTKPNHHVGFLMHFEKYNYNSSTPFILQLQTFGGPPGDPCTRLNNQEFYYDGDPTDEDGHYWANPGAYGGSHGEIGGGKPSGFYSGIEWKNTQCPIPEPLTMLGMFLGLGSVGAYIRRRRMR